MGAITYEIMKQRQALPLEAKIAFSEIRIRAWYEHWNGDVYISFSGGKDSTVLLDLVKRIYPDVPAVFCDTGLEYPEVRQFALSNADVVIKPRMNFKNVIETYGYPIPSKEQAQFIREARHTKSAKLRNLRINGNGKTNMSMISARWLPLLYAPFEVSEKCCNEMKKKPFKEYAKKSGRKKMTGMMACESALRERCYINNGCNAFEAKDPGSMPLAIWLDQDILMYLHENNLPYASCYGEIVEKDGVFSTTRENRTGCMFCMFGVHLDGKPNRFQRMERDYPKQYDYCINKLKIGEVLDYCKIPYRYERTLFEVAE